MERNDQKNSEQQPITQPADNGDQGNQKLFTQEEVNTIVQDRLARERAKRSPQEPTEEEKRLKDLNDRESKVACREFILDQGLPSSLLDVLDTSNPEEFKNKAEIVMGMLADTSPAADNSKIEEMKLRIAQERLIPKSLASRLKGETEHEIRLDAEAMHKIICEIRGPDPLAQEDTELEYSTGKGFEQTKHTPKQYGRYDEI